MDARFQIDKEATLIVSLFNLIVMIMPYSRGGKFIANVDAFSK